MEKLFLLDAYALIFRAYYAMIKTPRINSKGVNTSAILGFVNTLMEILGKDNPTHIGIAFDPAGGTFRHKLYDEYKAQRQETPEVIRESVPVIKEIIRAFNIPILEVEGFEADDVIGTLSKQADKKEIDTYMLTPDKDYCQLVTEKARIYRPKYGDKGYEVMDTAAVLEKYGIENTSQIIDLLGLMGDSADNIPGCPGVGPKTAQKLIADFGSIENLLENTDKLKGALKEKVEENAGKIKFSKMLATIRTDVPIELDMESLKRQTPDLGKLRKILEELEMKGLLGRIMREYDDDTQKTPADQTPEGFQANIFDIFTQDGTGNFKNENLSEVRPVELAIKIIDNKQDTLSFTNACEKAGKIAFQIDTTQGNPVFAEITGIGFATSPDTAWYLPKPDSKDECATFCSIVRDIMENESILKISHNIKPAILALAGLGITIKGTSFDTMVAHYVLQPEQKHSLEFLSETILKETIPDNDEQPQTEGMLFFTPDMDKVSRISGHKAVLSLKLEPLLSDMLNKDGTWQLFNEIEMPLTGVLADMERCGARIDPKALQESSRLFTDRMLALEQEIFQEVGFSFNILSPKQVGEVLFDKLRLSDKAKKTKSGQYVTSEEVLEGLRDKSPVVEKILQYRGLKKLTGTYVDALPAIVSTQTGKIHTSFNQTVTATGRLSSSNPNLQNIPVRDEDGKEVRKAFIPDPGCKFFSADYSQIELRIMAHLSGDANMLEDFAKGEDIHAATAAKIFHKPVEEVTKSERAKAKTANFGIIYGISAFGLAERMKVSRTEAKELIENYFKTYPGIRDYINRQIEDARRKGYIETLMHRKRYLPDITSHNATVRGYAERNAVNAPIQGSAADIIKCAMVRISRRLKESGARSQMILQVHDELNFNVVPGEENLVSTIVMEEMQNAYPMSVRLLADCGWGNNWLEAH